MQNTLRIRKSKKKNLNSTKKKKSTNNKIKRVNKNWHYNLFKNNLQTGCTNVLEQAYNSKQEQTKDEVRTMSKKLENLITDRKQLSKKQINYLNKQQTPHVSAMPPYRNKKKSWNNKKTWNIGDVYEYKQKLAKKEKKNCSKGMEIHPTKIDRLYRKHKRIKEWEAKQTPKDCTKCLKKKWKSKLQEKPIISNFRKEHRPGYFLTKKQSRSKSNNLFLYIKKIFFKQIYYCFFFNF